MISEANMTRLQSLPLTSPTTAANRHPRNPEIEEIPPTSLAARYIRRFDGGKVSPSTPGEQRLHLRGGGEFLLQPPLLGQGRAARWFNSTAIARRRTQRDGAQLDHRSTNDDFGRDRANRRDNPCCTNINRFPAKYKATAT